VQQNECGISNDIENNHNQRGASSPCPPLALRPRVPHRWWWLHPSIARWRRSWRRWRRRRRTEASVLQLWEVWPHLARVPGRRRPASEALLWLPTGRPHQPRLPPTDRWWRRNRRLSRTAEDRSVLGESQLCSSAIINRCCFCRVSHAVGSLISRSDRLSVFASRFIDFVCRFVHIVSVTHENT